MKLLSVPATSVLSEQVFSTAGMVSTKQRIKLTTRNIEMLVFLQRAMTNEDVHTLTAEDFRAQRRRVLEVKRAKEREDVLTDISLSLLLISVMTMWLRLTTCLLNCFLSMNVRI